PLLILRFDPVLEVSQSVHPGTDRSTDGQVQSRAEADRQNVAVDFGEPFSPVLPNGWPIIDIWITHSKVMHGRARKVTHGAALGSVWEWQKTRLPSACRPRGSSSARCAGPSSAGISKYGKAKDELPEAEVFPSGVFVTRIESHYS